jgi:hypothetical protein
LYGTHIDNDVVFGVLAIIVLVRGLTFYGALANIFSLLVLTSALYYACISFCISQTVLCDSLSDFVDLDLVVPMLERNKDAIADGLVVVPCLFISIVLSI